MGGTLEFVAKLFSRRGQPPLPIETRVACFREVLHANNSALGAIARIQEALDGTGPLSVTDVRAMVAGKYSRQAINYGFKGDQS